MPLLAATGALKLSILSPLCSKECFSTRSTLQREEIILPRLATPYKGI